MNTSDGAIAENADASRSFLLQNGQTLVCLGDSITQNAHGYCAMIAALIAATYPERGIRVINAGISGHKVTDMLLRVDRDVLHHRPDWVTVSVGVNDVWHGMNTAGTGGVTLPEYRAHLDTLIQRVQSSGAQVVLLPPTVIGEDPASEGNQLLQPYRAAVRELAAAYRVRVAPTDIDLNNALAAKVAQGGEPGKTLTTDGVHLRGPGDAILAVAVLKALGFFAL